MSSDPSLSRAHPSVAAYYDIIARMRKALKNAGRAEDSASLTAVSKNQDWATIEPVLNAGQRIFGENRVQEAQMRWHGIKDRYADLQLRLIGPLQSNKAKEAVALFDVIESLDREKILGAIADEMAKQGRAPKLFVQVNIGQEAQKSGVLPQDTDAFLKMARETYGLKIEGLMCIPPVARPTGPYFALLAKIAARNAVANLSMGMSDDFETALLFGSTHIRVGSAIFGAR
jgi:hypothetical protein